MIRLPSQGKNGAIFRSDQSIREGNAEEKNGKNNGCDKKLFFNSAFGAPDRATLSSKRSTCARSLGLKQNCGHQQGSQHDLGDIENTDECHKHGHSIKKSSGRQAGFPCLPPRVAKRFIPLPDMRMEGRRFLSRRAVRPSSRFSVSSWFML